GPGRWQGFIVRFDRAFDRLRDVYRAALGAFITRRRFGLVCAAAAIATSFLLLFVVGEDFFPAVDAGMMKLHVRAPPGPRLERTQRIVDDVERTIGDVIPENELASIGDNIGTPISYNLAFHQTDSIGPQDADILVQLQPKHAETRAYQEKIRRRL